MNEKNEMKSLIVEYIGKEECNYMCDDIQFDCENCTCFKDCYFKSCERCNSEFADDIKYNDYDTTEVFWEQI